MHGTSSRPSKCAASTRPWPAIMPSSSSISTGLVKPNSRIEAAICATCWQRRAPAPWSTKWSGKYSKLTGWVEENIDETLAFYRLPRQHHKHLKSTNMLERLNEEIRRRTQVVRIFPNGESCLRLVRALAVETHENWLEQHRYLNMDDRREHKKEALRRAA